MKGLLHRIAARAAGTAVAVRADVGAQRATGHGAASDGIAVEPVASSTPAPRRTVGTADDLASDPLSVPRPEPSPASVPTTASVRRPPAHASPHVSGWSAVAASKPTPPSLATANADTRAPGRAAFGAPLNASSDGVGRRPTRDAAREARMPSDADDPARLLPVGPRPAPIAALAQAAHRAAPAQGPGAWGDADADTEVHIHIGRIDVTAVPQATPPPRRRAAPAPAPLSLDGYLAQRGRS